MPLMSALVLLNYVLTDGVVVWRDLGALSGWIQKKFDYSSHVLMPDSLAISVLTDTQHAVAEHKGISLVLDYIQVANLVLSLLTNICSTSIVGIKACSDFEFVGIIDTGSRVNFTRGGKTITTAEQIFALLVESGIIYCLSGLMVLVATVVRLPFGTLGDVYTPVNVQFAVGVY
ncbi:hypothetical protein F5146DRAFT_1000559 [Armillaria mellea]|nr:hypothetical protein F5146DRAFT_1000559 [Armillaria mellea]